MPRRRRNTMSARSIQSILIIIVMWTCMAIWSAPLRGQDKGPQPPPATVSVAKVEAGLVAPEAEFIGTVYYQEVSDVASELSGLAQAVRFEEGQRVKKAQALVELGSELLSKNLQATLLTHEQVLSELEIARIELTRKEKLFQKKSIAEQTYDQDRFRVVGLEKRAASLAAQVERIEIELNKKTIRAPTAVLLSNAWWIGGSGFLKAKRWRCWPKTMWSTLWLKSRNDLFNMLSRAWVFEP